MAVREACVGEGKAKKVFDVALKICGETGTEFLFKSLFYFVGSGEIQEVIYKEAECERRLAWDDSTGE